MKTLIALGALSLALAFGTADAATTPGPFCWDKTDKVIIQLKKVDLTNDQLRQLIVYQKEHRAVIKDAHSNGHTCRMHEDHHVEFERSAFGVLSDEQFEKAKGRARTEVESLRHENYELQQELAAMRKELAALRAELAAARGH